MIIPSFLPSYHQIPHVLLAAISVASVVNFRFQKHAVIAFHAIIGTLLLIYPTIIHGPTVSGGFDVVHGLLQRFTAATHLGFVVYHLRNFRNLSRTEPIVHLTKAITAVFLLLTQLLTAYQLHEVQVRGLNVSDNFLISVLFIDGVWLCTEIYRILDEWKRAGSSDLRRNFVAADEIDLMCKRTHRWVENGRVCLDTQSLFWLDSAISLIHAFFNFAFANEVLNLSVRREYVISPFHVLYHRMSACHAIVPALLSLVASHFSVNNQKSYVFMRITKFVVTFLVHSYGLFILNLYNSSHIVPYILSGFYLAVLVMLYFCVTQEERLEKRANGGDDQEQRTTTYTLRKTVRSPAE